MKLEGIPLNITRQNMSQPCRVPVLPGTEAVDAPFEDRTEYCATDGWWAVGALPCCDTHFRAFCEQLKLDYDGIVAEVKASGWGGDIPNSVERKPFAERPRYESDVARIPKKNPE